MSGDVVYLEEALRRQVRRKLMLARRKWGDRFDLLCLEMSLDKTLDDRTALRLLRVFDGSGSLFGEASRQG
jgi:hypothetical protein